MYLSIYVSIYLYLDRSICLSTYLYTSDVRKHERTRREIYSCVYTYIHICTFECVHIYIYMYIHICTYTTMVQEPQDMNSRFRLAPAMPRALRSVCSSQAALPRLPRHGLLEVRARLLEQLPVAQMHNVMSGNLYMVMYINVYACAYVYTSIHTCMHTCMYVPV